MVFGRHHGRLRRASAALVLSGAAGLAACAAYAPAPIDSARAQADFEARSLDDPGLVAFARASLPEGAPFPPPAWDLESLTVVALEEHPDVALARAEFAAARAGTITASARPNPTLVLDPEYVANAGGGLQSWVLGARLDVTLETAGKRDLRTERAERLTDAAELALYETAWSVRSRLRAALLDNVMLDRELALLREEERLRREALVLLQQRLALGQISRPDLSTAEIEHSRVELDIRVLETRQRESRVHLAEALGLPERALDGRPLAWKDETSEELRSVFDAQKDTALIGRLDLRRSLAEYAASEADLELEVAKQYPDVTLGPGYLYDQGAHKILLGVAMPLPIFNQNQGPIAEAEARRHTAGVKFLALQARAIGEIETARARFEGAEQELAQATAVLEGYRRREREVGRAVELGADDRLALAEAQIQRAVFARAELDATQKLEAALGDLEDALQRPLEKHSAKENPPEGIRPGESIPGRSKGETMTTRTLHALALSCTLAVWVAVGCGSSAEKEAEASREPAVANAAPAAPARGPHGEAIVRLEKEAQARLGLATAKLVAHEMIPELVAYGRVMPDPSTSFALRAPIAGTLITSSNSAAWPAVGTEVAGGGAELGAIKPRLTAVERGDIATRAAAAHGELEASRASLTAAKAALERTRALNADDKNASDRALEEAQARVKAEEARGASAAAAIETLQGLLEPGSDSKAAVPVALGNAGTVVEVLAHPGESVDAGAVLLRLQSFDRLLARIDMPLDGADHGAPEAIRIAAVGNETRFFSARRVGPAAEVEIANQGGALLYAFEQAAERAQGTAPAPALRPGQAVVAWIPESSTALKGFIVPRSAVLRFGGKAWVYDAGGEEEFTRREIALDQPIDQGWFVTAPWAGAARVVVTGAAGLLSEEILGSQMKHGEEP